MATVCSTIQQSLAWCQGTPELPGIKRRIYYISKDQIVSWPTLTYDALGRLTSAAYSGSFVLAADATWKFIDILTDKSQLTSDPQGEFPSQTQLNKLVAVHPSVGVESWPSIPVWAWRLRPCPLMSTTTTASISLRPSAASSVLSAARSGR